jgi:CheY-like chemotaxis protein
MPSSIHPILLIEDEENDSFLLSRAFVSADIASPIQVVKNGARAISYLLGEPPFQPREYYPPPRLVLLDLNLPDMTGLEFLSWRQTRPALKRIPVVVLTTSPLGQDVAAAYDAGANGYLVKPVSQDALVAILQALRDFWLVHNTLPNPEADPPGSTGANRIPAERWNGHPAVLAPEPSAGEGW